MIALRWIFDGVSAEACVSKIGIVHKIWRIGQGIVVLAIAACRAAILPCRYFAAKSTPAHLSHNFDMYE